MKSMSFVTLVAAALIAIPAAAQTQSTPRVDQRQANQERRIERGEKSGALNDKEAALQGAATAMPCSENALRIALAKLTAPGWSPCRHSVSGATGIGLPESEVT